METAKKSATGSGLTVLNPSLSEIALLVEILPAYRNCKIEFLQAIDELQS
jgi:hypothetical protein